MPDCDEDSPRLRQNLKKLLSSIRDQAEARKLPTLDDTRNWHREMMSGLMPPDRKFVGQFRGSSGLSHIEVAVGAYPGVPACKVAEETARFEVTLQHLIQHLDTNIPKNSSLNPDQLSAVIEACAWTHAEWVRIHPFANGNGRTARLWANAIAMRYNLPPFIKLRPRPNFGYQAASAQAMLHNHHPLTLSLHQMLSYFLQNK